MARRDPAPRDTRERILRSALEVFEERGYHAASIDDVAARAGVTKGAVYYWFTDKDDLARDLQQELWEQLKTAALATFEADRDIVSNLEHGLEAYLIALQRLGSARFFLRDAWTIPALAADEDERGSARALIKGFLELGIVRGEILGLDPDAMAAVLVGAYCEATLHILTTGGDPEPTVAVIRTIVRALATAKRTRQEVKASTR